MVPHAWPQTCAVVDLHTQPRFPSAATQRSQCARPTLESQMGALLTTADADAEQSVEQVIEAKKTGNGCLLDFSVSVLMPALTAGPQSSIVHWS